MKSVSATLDTSHLPASFKTLIIGCVLGLLILSTPALFQASPDPAQDKSKAETITALANELHREGSAESLRKAVEKYDEALLLYRALADRRSEAITLNNIGVVYDTLGEKRKALDYYQQALPVWRAMSDRDGEATTLGNLGVVYSDLGENQIISRSQLHARGNGGISESVERFEF